MTAKEIRDALDAGKKVRYGNGGVVVIKDSIGQYLMKYSTNYCIGLTWLNGVTLNGKAEDFAIAE